MHENPTAMTATESVCGVDLSDEELYIDGSPERIWKRLRDECPVYWNPLPDGTGFWAITRHADVARILKDPKVFVSEQGMRIGHNPAATAAAAGKLLIVTDPPRHVKIRRVVSAAFTPRMVARLEENMRVFVREEIDSLPWGEPFEFTEFAARLPLAVICDLLGVPKPDWHFMLDSTRIAFGASNGDPLEQLEAHAAVMEYYEQLVDRRRTDPQEDVVSAMVHGTVDGIKMTDEEIFLNCDGLISGGNETTRHAITGGMLALINNPEQRPKGRASSGEMRALIDEILRYTSPALHVLRTARHDTEISGQLIRAGEAVALWLPSANRDERVFERPEAFYSTRTENSHLAFGVGPHHCLGAPLARTELSVLFAELLATVAYADLVSPALRLRSNLIWGFEALPVKLHHR